MWRAASIMALGLALLGCATDTAELREAAARLADHSPAAVRRGEYIFNAANCVSCHTDSKHGGARLAGGRAIETAFGSYYSRNITPDPTDGIGAWSDADFLRALRDGISPSGAHYFPAFPFPSFTLMSDRDILDLKAYLDTQKPVAQPNRPHDVSFPFDVRLGMVFWRMLYFTPGPFAVDAAESPRWNRGAYLVNAVGHCGECHTPRNALGALRQDRRFGGAPLFGPGNKRAANITPDPTDGIGKWSPEDITTLLATGQKPDGDFVNSTMGDVVEVTAKLTPDDRLAIAAYLKSLPPLPSRHR